MTAAWTPTHVLYLDGESPIQVMLANESNEAPVASRLPAYTLEDWAARRTASFSYEPTAPRNNEMEWLLSFRWHRGGTAISPTVQRLEKRRT